MSQPPLPQRPRIQEDQQVARWGAPVQRRLPRRTAVASAARLLGGDASWPFLRPGPGPTLPFSPALAAGERSWAICQCRFYNCRHICSSAHSTGVFSGPAGCRAPRMPKQTWETRSRLPGALGQVRERARGAQLGARHREVKPTVSCDRSGGGRRGGGLFQVRV